MPPRSGKISCKPLGRPGNPKRLRPLRRRCQLRCQLSRRAQPLWGLQEFHGTQSLEQNVLLPPSSPLPLLFSVKFAFVNHPPEASTHKISLSLPPILWWNRVGLFPAIFHGCFAVGSLPCPSMQRLPRTPRMLCQVLRRRPRRPTRWRRWRLWQRRRALLKRFWWWQLTVPI